MSGKNDFYSTLGLTPIINAAGNQTVYGGSTPSGDVKAAMEAAEDNYIVMEELFQKTGEYIAKLLGAESGYVTSGAAAAITLSVAGCMAGTDPEKIATLPRTDGMKNEILLQKPQRYTYDRCFELSGAKLVEVGSSDHCSKEELEAAINDNTVAIAYYVQPDNWESKAVSIEEALEIAHNNNIPLIADAASQIYPIDYMLENAQRADLVCFGAKYFGAPHSSGIVVGKKEYVDKVKAQSFIAYQLEGRNAMGRPMKLDRQEVIGAVVALEQWLKMNHEDRFSVNIKKQESIAAEINTISGVSSEVTEIPTFIKYSLKVNIDPNVMSAKQLAEELANGSPRIMVTAPADPSNPESPTNKIKDITAAGHGIETGNNFLLINTSEVSESQISQISNRIKEILSK